MWRWLGVTLWLAGQLPVAAVSTVALLDVAGDHEVRCEVREDSVLVVLHHPEGGVALPHRHNVLDALVAGSDDGTDHDHRLGFGRVHCGAAGAELEAPEPVEKPWQESWDLQIAGQRVLERAPEWRALEGVVVLPERSPVLRN